MSFQKFKIDSYCVGGRHRSATVKIYDDTTSKGSKLLNGFCSVCKRKKSMTVSDNKIKAEGLGDFLKNLGKVSSKAAKKIATNALKNSSRFLEIGGNVATAAVSKSPKADLSALPEVIKFYHTGKGLYLGEFVFFLFKNGSKN